MIKSIYLNGFKSFGAATTIDLREITLLYGENSAGKSSILQALQYAREVFCNDNLDCLKTELGGEFVNLRGFKNFVHGKDIGNLIEIGLTVTSTGAYLLKYGLLECDAAKEFANFIIDFAPLHQDVHDDLSNFLRDNPESIFLENMLHLPTGKSDSDEIEMSVIATIGMTKKNNLSPAIIGLHAAIEGEPIVEISRLDQEQDLTSSDKTHERKLCIIYFDNKVIPSCYIGLGKLFNTHSKFNPGPDFMKLIEEFDVNPNESERVGDARASDGTNNQSEESLSAVSNTLGQVNSEQEANEDAGIAKLFEQASDNPSYGWRERLIELEGKSELEFETTWDFGSLKRLGEGGSFLYNLDLENLVFESHGANRSDTSAVDIEKERIYYPNIFRRPMNLTELKDVNFVGLYTGSLLTKSIVEIKNHLSEMQYIGPLRRHYTPPSDFKSRSEERCWSDGLGAWDRLAKAPGLIGTINKWLSDSSLFGFDCTVETTARLKDRFQDLFQEMDQGRRTELMAIFDELNLENRVTLRSKNGYNLESTEIGVGFSQVLPIVVAACGLPGVCLLLEQPELHIHVRLQAVLGDLLATNIRPRRNEVSQYIVETHSEALLLRLMRRIRETTKEIVTTGPRLLCDHVAVYHVAKKDGISCAKRIELDTFGNLTEEWPDDLFDISFTERFGE